MIIKETSDLLRGLLGRNFGGLRVERAVVGIYFSAVKLSDGSGGMASTPPDPKAGQTKRARTALPPGALSGKPAGALLDAKDPDPVTRSLQVAALAALSSRFLTPDRYKVFSGRDALDLLEAGPIKRAAIVGAFSSYIKRLKKRRGVKLRVLELNRNALAAGDRKFFAPAADAPSVLRSADTVIITGASITNGTVDGLLEHIKPGSRAAIVGPTGSFLPDAFFKKGVSMVSGARIYKADLALDLLAQGGRAHHLYGSCARKINLMPL